MAGATGRRSRSPAASWCRCFCYSERRVTIVFKDDVALDQPQLERGKERRFSLGEAEVVHHLFRQSLNRLGHRRQPCASKSASNACAIGMKSSSSPDAITIHWA